MTTFGTISSADCPDGGMVYTKDLKSFAVRLVGSSPTPGTYEKIPYRDFFICARSACKRFCMRWGEKAGALCEFSEMK